jgi:maleate cis-trans isomerase
MVRRMAASFPQVSGLTITVTAALPRHTISSVETLNMATRLKTPLHVGLMVPINNTTMERELLAWLPAGSACTTLRIPRGKSLLTPEAMPAYKTQALALAGTFADFDIDVVIYGCTAAGFIAGPVGEAELAAQLSEVTGKLVVTTALSMVLTLQETRAKDIALITPYPDHINEQLIVFLTEGDIRVKRLDSFRAADIEELGRIQSAAVADRARATMGRDCDALFIACSQLPTYDILDSLQTEFGRPAWSSIKATARQVRRALNLQIA